jgi:hypothetical protein
VDVAQLVEPRVVIPVVVGSSPIVHPSFRARSRGSVRAQRAAIGRFLGHCRIEEGPLAQLVEQETLNLLVVGSIPTRPTTFQHMPYEPHYPESTPPAHAPPEGKRPIHALHDPRELAPVLPGITCRGRGAKRPEAAANPRPNAC